MRYAIIEDGKVASIVEWDGSFSDPDKVPVGHMVRSDVAEVGDAFDMDTGEFPALSVTPAEAEPEVFATETHTTQLDASADATIDSIEGKPPAEGHADA